MHTPRLQPSWPEKGSNLWTVPRPLPFPAAIVNLTVAGQPCFERGEKKGVLLTSEVEIARPGQGPVTAGEHMIVT